MSSECLEFRFIQILGGRRQDTEILEKLFGFLRVVESFPVHGGRTANKNFDGVAKDGDDGSGYFEFLY